MTVSTSSPPGNRVLDMSVSEFLACHADVLPLLVEHGFTPLDNPALRRVLAPTVTLAQALRLHPLAPEGEWALLTRLEALCRCE